MMSKRSFADSPLAEITLRKYELPNNLDDRQLVKKVCLSLGLLQPADSRDVIVDILYVFLKTKAMLTSKEIEEKVIEFRKFNNLPLVGVAPSNIRRQLLRLRELFIVEKIENKYRLSENLSLSNIFREKIEGFLISSILDRIKIYLEEVDKRFNLD